MSVDHHFLSVSDDELTSILDDPISVTKLIEKRDSDHLWLGPEGNAIVALTAQSEDDPLAFIREGAPDAVSGWIEQYKEGGECEVDMGYGPGSFYRNSFLTDVAKKLEPISPELFAEHCDIDWLAEMDVYPTGWHDEGRRAELIEAFTMYRQYILTTAGTGQHLIVWCA